MLSTSPWDNYTWGDVKYGSCWHNANSLLKSQKSILRSIFSPAPSSIWTHVGHLARSVITLGGSSARSPEDDGSYCPDIGDKTGIRKWFERWPKGKDVMTDPYSDVWRSRVDGQIVEVGRTRTSTSEEKSMTQYATTYEHSSGTRLLDETGAYRASIPAPKASPDRKRIQWSASIFPSNGGRGPSSVQVFLPRKWGRWDEQVDESPAASTINYSCEDDPSFQIYISYIASEMETENDRQIKECKIATSFAFGKIVGEPRTDFSSLVEL